MLIDILQLTIGSQPFIEYYFNDYNESFKFTLKKWNELRVLGIKKDFVWNEWFNKHSIIIGKKELTTSAYTEIYNALKVACHRGFKNVLKLILKMGFDVRNSTFLCIALSNGYIDMAKLLCENCYTGYALIHFAEIGHYEQVKLLIDMGADIHTWQDTPIRIAAQNGYVKTAELLIEKGANIHVMNDAPLRQAVNNGHYDMVKLLIEKGANIHAEEECALISATKGGYTKIVKLLIDNGADIYVNDDQLFRYAMEKHYPAILLLFFNSQMTENKRLKQQIKEQLIHCTT